MGSEFLPVYRFQNSGILFRTINRVIHENLIGKVGALRLYCVNDEPGHFHGVFKMFLGKILGIMVLVSRPFAIGARCVYHTSGA